MTQLLSQALAEIQKLPEVEQDAIATIILDELSDERQWDEAFVASQDQLKQLVDRVRREVAAGKVRNIGIDEL